MKYSTDEAMQEILQRRENIIRKKELLRRSLLSCSAMAMFGMLILVLAITRERSSPTMDTSVYGALLLTPELGGVVLAAVIGFTLGVIITLLIIKKRSVYKDKMPDKEDMT